MQSSNDNDFDKIKAYVIALEATRRDLWSVNEELRDKIASLERGQLDILEALEKVYCAFHGLDYHSMDDSNRKNMRVWMHKIMEVSADKQEPILLKQGMQKDQGPKTA